MSKYTGVAMAFSGLPYSADEANQSHSLGELVVSDDGRSYRYVKAGGTALVAGELVQSPVEDTNDQSVLMAAASVGATSVTTADSITVTANQYAGGYLITTGEGGTGNGISYRIKSHPAATAATCTFTLEDPVQVAISAATQVDLVANPYNGVIQMPTTPTGAVLGVAANDVTASQYGWIQVGGVAAVKNDASGAITVGNLVTASQTTAGCVNAAAGGSTEAHPIVGIAVTGIAQAEFGAVKLLLN